MPRACVYPVTVEITPGIMKPEPDIHSTVPVRVIQHTSTYQPCSSSFLSNYLLTLTGYVPPPSTPRRSPGFLPFAQPGSPSKAPVALDYTGPEENVDEFYNLTQLAEVSLAKEGRLRDPSFHYKSIPSPYESRSHNETLFHAQMSRHDLHNHPSVKLYPIPAEDQPLNLSKSASPARSITPDLPLPPSAPAKPPLLHAHLPAPSPHCAALDLSMRACKEEDTREEKEQEDLNCYVCPECGKRYSTSSNLARHRQTHRALSDRKARQCPHCDKVYVSMPAYSMHVRTHTQGCGCPYCGKRFSRPWLLQGHIRTHTGERPFKCSICGKAFADKSNLRAHTQTHSGAKPHVCRRCGKAFALKSYLSKHEESSCMKLHRQAMVAA